MVGHGRNMRREYQPLRTHASDLGFSLQMASRIDSHVPQPQNAARDIAQQLHPDVENRRGDLVSVGEGTEHETRWGQSYGRPRWRRPDLALIIGGQVAMRQPQDVFGITPFLIWRNHDGIRHYEVHA